MQRALAWVLLVAAAPFAMADDKPSAPAPGAAVPDFTLKDVHRRPRALADYKGKKAVVVVFADTECPVANLYVPTLIELHKEYGDRVQFPEAGYVLSYGFNEWRLQPTVPIDSTSDASLKPTFESLNPRPATAPEVGGDVQVGAFNVYNYFTTFTSVYSQARGAADAEEFAVQKSKIVAAISGLGADVVALMEIENSVKLGEAPDEALADLVAGLNEAAGSEVWSYVATPAALHDAAITDFITSAIIYRNDVVSPVGDSMTVIDETVWDNAREPIAHADLVHQIDRTLFEHTRAHALDDMLAAPVLDDDRVDAVEVEELPKHETSWPRANDAHLSTGDHDDQCS